MSLMAFQRGILGSFQFSLLKFTLAAENCIENERQWALNINLLFVHAVATLKNWTKSTNIAFIEKHESGNEVDFLNTTHTTTSSDVELFRNEMKCWWLCISIVFHISCEFLYKNFFCWIKIRIKMKEKWKFISFSYIYLFILVDNILVLLSTRDRRHIHKIIKIIIKKKAVEKFHDNENFILFLCVFNENDIKRKSWMKFSLITLFISLRFLIKLPLLQLPFLFYIVMCCIAYVS